jgi:hypothetical protein
LYITLLSDATFFDALLDMDHDLATTAQAGGCLICGGRLDHADYPRKPRGGPATLAAAYETRTSFCCDACRKRLTPMSVRFLGRKVYLGVAVLLACVLRHGPAPWRLARLREQVGVSADTLRRWHRWWREAFVRTPFWKAVRARFAPAIAEAALPQSVLERFTGEGAARVEAALRWLGPVTTTSAATLPDARGGPAEDAS